MFKKLIFIALLISLAQPARAISPTEIRIQGITYVGVALALGGVHRLSKRSENGFWQLIDIVSGAALIAAGVAAIYASEEIIRGK